MGFLDRFKRDRPMTDAELAERSQVDGIRYRDLQVVGVMVEQAGINIRAPRELVFYSYFPTKAVATAFAAAQAGLGLDFKVSKMDDEYLAEHPDEPNPWSVKGTSMDRAMVPDFLRDTIDALEDGAAAAGGVYDGWEAGLTDAEAAALKG